MEAPDRSAPSPLIGGMETRIGGMETRKTGSLVAGRFSFASRLQRTSPLSAQKKNPASSRLPGFELVDC
jgi:hypothetical protein